MNKNYAIIWEENIMKMLYLKISFILMITVMLISCAGKTPHQEMVARQSQDLQSEFTPIDLNHLLKNCLYVQLE